MSNLAGFCFSQFDSGFSEMFEGEVQDFGEIALDDFFERIPALFEAVVGEAVLGEVVGFDLFGAHASADGATSGLNFGKPFFQ